MLFNFPNSLLGVDAVTPEPLVCVRSSDNLKDRAILTFCEALVKRGIFSYERATSAV